MKDTNVRAPWHRLLALLLGLVLVAAACGSDSDDGASEGDGDGAEETTTTTEEPARQPKKGGEITFGVESQVSSLMPGVAAQPADMVIALGIYDPIMIYEDGQVVPHLAESLESNDTLDVWELTLRDGITFHDGTPLNAEAVVKHFQRLQDPATACPCADTVSTIQSMEMPDGPEGLKVTFTLANPNVAFDNMLAGSSSFIPSPTSLEQLGDAFANQPVGTGPFKLAEFRAGERVVLEANENYWKTDENGIQLPYLDKITFLPIHQGSQRVTALQSGQIDIFQTAASDTIAQAEEMGFAAQKISGSSSTIVLFNTSKPPFDDVRARQAFAYAINKDVINDRVYDGVRVPSYSGFATDSPYFNPDAQTPEYDPEKAKALVEEVGGMKFTLSCINSEESNDILRISEQMLEAVGMEVELEMQEQGTYVQRIFSKGGDYEAACFRSSHFIEPDAIRPGLTTGDAGNLTFYSNPEVDQLLDEARQTSDFETRKDLYFRVQEITTEEIPVFTFLYDLFGNVYNDEVVGPPPPGQPNSLGLIQVGLLYRVDGEG